MSDSSAELRIKVCGITRVSDIECCAELGVGHVGLNFWPRSPRSIAVEDAPALVRRAGALGLEVVAVVVDLGDAELVRLRERTGIRWLQLHGREPPELLAALQPRAYKAIGVADAEDVAAAARFPGERILLDARVPGDMPGGTGHAFDWDLAVGLARERQLVLAGGLRPGNVAEAVRRVRPWMVDVASGVESEPGVKDPEKIRAFVAAARASGQTLAR